MFARRKKKSSKPRACQRDESGLAIKAYRHITEMRRPSTSTLGHCVDTFPRTDVEKTTLQKVLPPLLRLDVVGLQGERRVEDVPEGTLPVLHCLQAPPCSAAR